MRYLSETTRHLMNETAVKLARTGKDPVFFIESFMIINKSKFNEGALGNFWKDVKNWFRGGVGQVHAGRHDVEDEYAKAFAAIQTMVNHISKFRGADPSTEDDVLNLLNTVLNNMKSAQPMIKDLSDKVKSQARSQRDPRTYGSTPAHSPYVDVKDFTDLPTMNIRAEGGTKPVMQWFVNLRSGGKDKLATSIVANANVQKLPTPLLAAGEKDYAFLVNSGDALIGELTNSGVANRDAYAKVFAYLYQKLLSTKTDPMGDDPALYTGLPPYTKELPQFDKNDINIFLTWLLSQKKSGIYQIMNAAQTATSHRKITDIIPNVNKANALMKAISDFRTANPSSTGQFGNVDEEQLLRAIIQLNAKSKSP